MIFTNMFVIGIILSLSALCKSTILKGFAAGVGCGARSEIKTKLLKIKSPEEASICGYFEFDPEECMTSTILYFNYS